MNKLAWFGCVIVVVGCGKKKVGGGDGPAVEPAPAPAAAAAPAAAGPAVGTGPCVGKWTLALDAWAKGECDPEGWEVGRTFYVVRGGDGKYRVLQTEGVQDLEVTITSDEAAGCSIVAEESFFHRYESYGLQYVLESRGGVRANGMFSATSMDPEGEDESSCTRAFSLKASLAPLSPADLAFDPAKAKRELEDVLQGEESALTLKEFCELPAMQGTLPRKAQVKIDVDPSGRIAGLAIDGKDQGIDANCMFPSSLEEAMGPPAVTNLTGVAQTATFELELR
jgi:hypothetical protein